MDFQLPFEWWPWNSFSCEICCREVWENRNWSRDLFQWTALNTGWIFQRWHLIASGLSCGGPLHWAEAEEREKETRSGWELAIGVMQSLSNYTETSLPHFHDLPPSYLTLSDFSISRDLQGPKGELKEDCKFLKFHLLGCEGDMARVWGGLAVRQVTWKTPEHDDTKDWIPLKPLVSAGQGYTWVKWDCAK